ncbi:MAG: signal peptidase II [bacterium]
MQEVVQTGSIASQLEENGTKGRFQWLFLATAAVFFVVDLILKWTAMSYGAKFFLGPIGFELFLNKGIIFSLPVPKTIYLPIATAAWLAMTAWLAIETKKRGSNIPGLTFIVLGAASNLFDNFRFGATVDYLIFFSRSAINLADIMIVIGVLLLIATGQRKTAPEKTAN